MTLSGKPRSPVAYTTNPGLTSFMAASSKRKSAGKVQITRPDGLHSSQGAEPLGEELQERRVHAGARSVSQRDGG
jgi:hypothetical protein